VKLPSYTTILFLLFGAFLASCNGTAPTPVTSPTHAMEAAAPPMVGTAFTETNTAIPVFSPTPIDLSAAAPSPRPLLPTEDSRSIPGGIVYYHFVNLAEKAPPPGSVVILPDNLVLAPTQLDQVYGSDVATDLRSALQAVLQDKRNAWFGDKLQVSQLTFGGGHANLVLEGKYYAVAPVVLTAARAQILMSLFANPAVQSARVTINGDTIANIAISNSMDAKPADYTYTRTEIETFMAENAYTQP
jgi:hypothetical protein